MDAVTEALFSVRARLLGTTDWSFGDWRRCTCGHIYSVTRLAGGSTADLPIGAIYYGARDGGLYGEVLRAIRDAHPELEGPIAVHSGEEDDPGRIRNPAFWVSDATALVANALISEPAEDAPIVDARHAIQLIDETIAYRLAKQRATMREVAASRTDEQLVLA